MPGTIFQDGRFRFEVKSRRRWRFGITTGSQSTIRWTKYSLNNWLRLAGPGFDAALALEFMGFAGPDVQEGIAALRQKRPPHFSSPASE